MSLTDGRKVTRQASGFLTAEEERELAARSRQGDQEAERRLVSSHHGFVVRIARKYRRYGIPMNDLVQEGLIGLLQAVRRFDPSRENRLSTYASAWVKSAIQDHVARTWSLVRGGSTSAQKALFFHLRRAVSDIKGSAGELNEEIITPTAKRLGVPLKDAMSLAARVTGFDQSLNDSTGEDGREELIDRLPDDAPTPEDAAAEASAAEARRGLIARAMKALSERERAIIAARYLSEIRKTRETIGNELGITAERVRQLELKALGKLRRLLAPFRSETIL